MDTNKFCKLVSFKNLFNIINLFEYIIKLFNINFYINSLFTNIENYFIPYFYNFVKNKIYRKQIFLTLFELFLFLNLLNTYMVYKYYVYLSAY